MRKKVLISLAPLLAIVAFSAMATVAQATPHYYSELKEIKKGTKLPTVSWGTLKLTNNLKPTEPIECENAIGGFVENPLAGTAGVGQTQGWAAYNCKNLKTCEGAAAGAKISVQMENESQPGLPHWLEWGNELIEEEGHIKLLSKNVRVYVRCQIVQEAPTETAVGFPAFQKKWSEIEAGGTTCTTNAVEGGIQHPILENGGEAAKPSKVVFETGAPTGELACNVIGEKGETIASKGATSGSLKTLGYKEQETIDTK